MTERTMPAPVIVCAAIKYLMMDPKDDIVVCGARHYDKLMHAVVQPLRLRQQCVKEIQGFVDQFGNFHNRKEARIIAEAANQANVTRPHFGPPELLFSEDLY